MINLHFKFCPFCNGKLFLTHYLNDDYEIISTSCEMEHYAFSMIDDCEFGHPDRFFEAKEWVYLDLNHSTCLINYEGKTIFQSFIDGDLEVKYELKFIDFTKFSLEDLDGLAVLA